MSASEKIPKNTNLGASSSSYCDDCVTSPSCVLSGLSDGSTALRPVKVRERRFRAGELLREAGGCMPRMQVIKVGSVMVSRLGVDGVARPVAILGQGYPMGHFDLTEGVDAFSCQAISAGRLCEVDVHELKEVAGPELRNRLLACYGRALSELADWAHVLRIKGVAGQLAGALVQLGHVQRSTVVRLPGRTVLASLLGASRETVARMLTLLEQRGALIRRDRTHFQLDHGVLMREMTREN